MALQWPHQGAKNFTKWAPEAGGEKFIKDQPTANKYQENTQMEEKTKCLAAAKMFQLNTRFDEYKKSIRTLHSLL